jgi:biopolymer transport protein ExbD
MAFSTGNKSGPLSDINVTPLVDVLLVLLIIFMVTAPAMTYQIQIDLPQPSRVPPPPQTATPIELKIDAGGQVTWNGSPTPMSALLGVMKVEAQRYTQVADQPVVNINTDQDAQYDALAKVLATAKNAGLVKIGFVNTNQH